MFWLKLLNECYVFLNIYIFVCTHQEVKQIFDQQFLIVIIIILGRCLIDSL